MPHAPLGFLLRHAYTSVSRTEPLPARDAELWDRYTAMQDETAFAELVLRHGALVLGVCERVLGQSQDAEDAFQATFLVLARRASAIRKPAALASWLYGVAARVARKARAAAVKRRLHESRAMPCRSAESADDMSWRELRQVLDEELQQLPERYRLPLLLCYLEGKTHDEAARQLGWTAGRFTDRLKRGRLRLRGRLQRRGVALPAALGAALLAQRVAGAAALPVVRFALARAGGSGESGSLRATALAEGVLRGMSLLKWKVTAVVLFAVGALIAAASQVVPGASTAPQLPADRPAAVQTAQAPSQPRAQAEPPKEDVFGDPLPPHALARMGTIRYRHGYLIEALAMSPDGKAVATAGSDETLRLWDLATGKELRRFSQEKRPYAVAFSPDGKLLASADSTIRLWDLTGSGEARQIKVGKEYIRALAFSADGKLLASAGDDKLIRLWDVATGKELRGCGGHESVVRHLAFAPDGSRLASADGGHTVSVWDVAAAKRVRQFPGGETQYLISSVAFTSDGKGLLSGSKDNTIRWWNVETGEEVRCFRGHEKDVRFVTMTRDGKTLASAGWDRTIRLWDATTGKEKHCIRDSAWGAAALAFTPDGAILVSGGAWDSAIHRWDVATGKEIRTPGAHQGPIDAVGFLADGKTVVSASRDNTVRLWDRQTGKEIKPVTLPGAHPWLITLSPDLRTVAFADRDRTKLRLWDVLENKEVRVFDLPAPPSCLAFAPDGKRLVTGGQDGKIRLWDVVQGKELLALDAHGQKEVSCLAVAPNGTVLASAGQDGSLCLWDVTTGKELHRVSGLGTPVMVLRFSPDSRLLAGGGFSSELYLADVAERRILRKFSLGGDYVASIAFSADGRLLAASGEKQNVHLIELATGDEIAQFPGDTGALAFSPDGRTLLAGNYDSSMLVWDVTGSSVHGREWQTLRAEAFDRLWADLRSSKAATAHRALWALAGGDARIVRQFKDRLHPVVVTDAARVAKAIEDLQSEKFERRQQAYAELEKLGEQAEPQLREALTKQATLELHRRIEQLLARLDQLDGPGDWLRRMRAFAVLEQMDVPEAEQLLKAIAAGAAEARLTKEAKAALERRIRRQDADR